MSLRRARLSLTPLENRETPAVMTYSPGAFFGNSGDVDLSIQFTGTNAIVWNTSPPTTPAAFAAGTSTLGGNLNITLLGVGTNTAGTPSTKGNVVTVNLGGHALTGNLTIMTGNGADTVSVFGGTVFGTVSITTNGQADDVSVAGGPAPSLGLTVGKNLVIAEGAANDSITFGPGALTVGGNSSINMGPGNHTYNLASQIKIGGNLQVQAGVGNDPINQVGVAGSSVGGNATFLAGAGANSLDLPAGLTIGGNAIYVGGTGTDNVTYGATTNGNLLCLLSAGNDRFTYAAFAPFVGGSAFIDGGAGAGDIYLQLTIPTWPNTVIGFP